jgi:hypothetical protein
MASIPEPVAEQPAQPPDAVNAVPPAHLLRVLEWRTGLEYPAARRAARRIADWPRGDGHPVLVIPGFLADRFSTQLLRNVLRRLGYRVYDWGLGYNVGYRSSMTETLPARLLLPGPRTGCSSMSARRGVRGFATRSQCGAAGPSWRSRSRAAACRPGP